MPRFAIEDRLGGGKTPGRDGRRLLSLAAATARPEHVDPLSGALIDLELDDFSELANNPGSGRTQPISRVVLQTMPENSSGRTRRGFAAGRGRRTGEAGSTKQQDAGAPRCLCTARNCFGRARRLAAPSVKADDGVPMTLLL